MPELKNKVLDQRVIEVSRKDLPLSCPMPDVQLWSSHPAVYLPIEITGVSVCPYCSTEYILKD